MKIKYSILIEYSIIFHIKSMYLNFILCMYVHKYNEYICLNYVKRQFLEHIKLHTINHILYKMYNKIIII